MEERQDVWIWLAPGDVPPTGLELVAPGRTLAQRLGSGLSAVVIGESADELITAAAGSGVDRIVVADGEAYGVYRTDVYTAALRTLVEHHRPAVLLFSADQTGRELAAAVAAALKAGLAQDVVALETTGTGSVLFTRPVLGGKQMAAQICGPGIPQIATVRPGTFRHAEAFFDAPPPTVVQETIRVPDSPLRVSRQIRVAVQDKVDLEGAEIIIAGGRGLGSPKGFDLIREAAEALGAQVAASRAAVDLGWISHAHQVGQSGARVSPRLYIACGISGAMQHLAGMSGSDVIVAINKDPRAPIFQVADYGVEGDLYKVLPPLIEVLKKR